MNDDHDELFNKLLRDQQDALKSDEQSIREAAINNVNSQIEASEHDQLVKDALKKKVREFFQES